MVRAPHNANQNKQPTVKARKKVDHKEHSNAKASQKAGEKKQSVIDGFQGLFTKAPVPTSSGQIAETPFLKSDKGSKSCNDGWESDWESDVDKWDDTSLLCGQQ
ncbi:unnamed protein product [Penicillium nalgiovense]|nr:unnamed protein product [Penicillium nalgiovense]